MTFTLRPYQKDVMEAVKAWSTTGMNGYVVSPGGSGKSLMIAKTAELYHSLGKWPIVLARSERLLSQNRSKISDHLQDEVGYYCASLNEKTIDKPITVASIQSVINAPKVPAFDVCIVDECHGISEDESTQYQQFFERAGNPQLIGYTATPYRQGSGNLSWGGRIYEVEYKELFEAGYILPPVNKGYLAPDLSSIPIIRGEFVESRVANIFLEPELLTESLRRLIAYGNERNSVVVFCQSLKHAETITEALNDNGQSTIMVSGDTPKCSLNTHLANFEKRQFKYLVNCDILTEGYDMPSCDMVAILRATVSKAKFEQMAVRGTRLFPNKKDFFLLDMGGNLERHGPIGSPFMEKAKGEQRSNPYKICPSCEESIPITSKECPECGYVMIKDEPPKIAHDLFHDTESQTVFDPDNQRQDFKVVDVTYNKHVSKAGNETIRVDYHIDFYGGRESEYLAINSENEWAQGRCSGFFEMRGVTYMFPSEREKYGLTTEDMIKELEGGRKPVGITVRPQKKNPKYKEVVNYEWEASTGSGNSTGAGEVAIDDEIRF